MLISCQFGESNSACFYRAIHFYTYGNGKKFYTDLNHGKETSIVHLASAATAGKVEISCLLLHEPLNFDFFSLCRHSYFNSNKSYLGDQDKITVTRKTKNLYK